jgi:hypothetical protein
MASRNYTDLYTEQTRRLKIPKTTIAVSAFIMSLTTAAINSYYALRGSEMLILPPKSIIYYRDGSGDNATLIAAIPLSFINSADNNHGDVLLNAALNVGKAQFDWMSEVSPVFRARDSAGSNCPSMLRCIEHEGITLIEKDGEILSFAGGVAITHSLAFPIDRSNCVNDTYQCRHFKDFKSSADMISIKRNSLSFNIRFHSDGVRNITCVTGKIPVAYISKVGWASLPCLKSEVNSGKFF